VERKVLNSLLMETGEGRRPACPAGGLEKKDGALLKKAKDARSTLLPQ
jgi:hypothetical protein